MEFSEDAPLADWDTIEKLNQQYWATSGEERESALEALEWELSGQHKKARTDKGRVEELVSKCQSGEDVFEELREELTPLIMPQVFRSIFPTAPEWEVQQRAIAKMITGTPSDADDWESIEVPFVPAGRWEKEDIEKAVRKALRRSLKHYDPAEAAAFTTFFTESLQWALKDLYREYFPKTTTPSKARTVADLDSFTFDPPGDPLDVIRESTSELDPIPEKTLEALTPGEADYMALLLTCPMSMTDATAATLLDVSERSVRRFRSNLKDKLAPWWEGHQEREEQAWEQRKKAVKQQRQKGLERLKRYLSE